MAGASPETVTLLREGVILLGSGLGFVMLFRKLLDHFEKSELAS